MYPTEVRSTLTQIKLRELLHYDPATGNWTRLVASGRMPAGSSAGELKSSGYVLISVDGIRYRAHRLAWLYMTGHWAPGQIDHRNGIRSDNRWDNFRLADNQQNQANKKRHRNNSSGFKGVFWNKQRGRWAAKINPNRRQVHLGFFDDPAVAHAAYCQAAQRYFGEFARAA